MSESISLPSRAVHQRRKSFSRWASFVFKPLFAAGIFLCLASGAWSADTQQAVDIAGARLAAGDPLVETLTELATVAGWKDDELSQNLFLWFDACTEVHGMAVDDEPATERHEQKHRLLEQLSGPCSDYTEVVASKVRDDLQAQTDAFLAGKAPWIELRDRVHGTDSNQALEIIAGLLDDALASLNEAGIQEAVWLLGTSGLSESPVPDTDFMYLEIDNGRVMLNVGTALMCRRLGGCPGDHPLMIRQCLWKHGLECRQPADFLEMVRQTHTDLEVDAFQAMYDQILTLLRESHRSEDNRTSGTGEFYGHSINRLLGDSATLADIDKALADGNATTEAAWTRYHFGTLCSNILTDPDRVRKAEQDPYRLWALDELRIFCGMDAKAWENGVTESGSPFDSATKLIEPLVKDQRYSDAIRASLERIGQTDDYFEILMLAQGLFDVQAQAFELTGDPDVIVIDPGAASDEEIAEASGKAALIFTCEIHGGCGIRHPFALGLCIEIGCERDLNTLEEAIYRTVTPREMEVLQQYLNLFRTQRRES